MLTHCNAVRLGHVRPGVVQVECLLGQGAGDLDRMVEVPALNGGHEELVELVDRGDDFCQARRALPFEVTRCVFEMLGEGKRQGGWRAAGRMASGREGERQGGRAAGRGWNEQQGMD